MSLQRLSLVLLLAAALVARADIATHDHELSDEQHYQDGEHNSVYDHEAFLGRDEAAEFDELHPEESKERLRKLVTKIDLNGDGFVDGDEMKAWIAKQLRKYIYHDVETQFEANDVDKNGKVTWDEFVNTTYGYIDDDEFEKDPQFELMVKRDKRRFERADGDDDKALDKDEYVRFMHPEESPDMADIVIDETLEDMDKDKDKDGSLSVEEYLGDPGVDPDTGNPLDWVAVHKSHVKRRAELNDYLRRAFSIDTEVSKSDYVYSFLHCFLRDEKDRRRERSPSHAVISNKHVGGEVKLSISYNQRKASLVIMVVHCRNLCPRDSNGLADPYVKLYLLPDANKSTKRKTKIVKKSLNPTYNESFQNAIAFNEIRRRTLQCTVWDHDRFSGNDFMGCALIALDQLDLSQEHEAWHKLEEIKDAD